MFKFTLLIILFIFGWFPNIPHYTHSLAMLVQAAEKKEIFYSVPEINKERHKQRNGLIP